MNRTILRGRAWPIIMLALVSGCASSVDQEMSTPGVAVAGDAPDRPDEADRLSAAESAKVVAEPPALASGGATLTWPDGRSVMLSNWNMVVDIMEGPGGTDSAEISLLATDPSLNEQLSITLFRPEITPETFALPGSYQVTDGAEGSETSIALWSDGRNLVTETGRVEVTSHEAGKVTGSLLARVTPEGSADPLEVRGDFEGLVHIACNALASLEADAPVGTSLDGDAGPVWTSVGIDDPFCAQYL